MSLQTFAYAKKSFAVEQELESIAPENSQDRSAWGGPSPSKQNFAWTLNAQI